MRVKPHCWLFYCFIATRVRVTSADVYKQSSQGGFTSSLPLSLLPRPPCLANAGLVLKTFSTPTM
jgi:hypothetical protein